jgi:hypothetical protein
MALYDVVIHSHVTGHGSSCHCTSPAPALQSLLRPNLMSQLCLTTRALMRCKCATTTSASSVNDHILGSTFLCQFSRRHLFMTSTRMCATDSILYTCDIDAEPLQRYCRGGYHPVKLGDALNGGTYKILHKLGWGGYSTVWAAKHQR